MRERQSVAGRGSRRTSEVRQAEIVAAVLELARDRGPDAITTQAIAGRIGVTQGAVFRHFPHKEAIWLAVFGWVRTALAEVLDAAIDEAASPLANLERVFCAHVELVVRNPGVPRVLFHELQTTGDSSVRVAVRAMIADYSRRLSRLFEQAKSAGEVSPELDTRVAPVLFIGAVQGLVIQAALGAGKTTVARNARPMFELLLDGCRGAGRRRPR